MPDDFKDLGIAGVDASAFTSLSAFVGAGALLFDFHVHRCGCSLTFAALALPTCAYASIFSLNREIVMSESPKLRLLILKPCILRSLSIRGSIFLVLDRGLLSALF